MACKPPSAELILHLARAVRVDFSPRIASSVFPRRRHIRLAPPSIRPCNSPHRTLNTSTRPLSSSQPVAASSLKSRKLASTDRGPASSEKTQTDFSKLNVYADTASPSTAIDVCVEDGFILDSGLRISDGDGVLLTAAEAFVWRPWMAAPNLVNKEVLTGTSLRRGKSVVERTGGVVNAKGQFEVADEAWGLLKAVWPKPDLVIVGTGASIRPLAPRTRDALQRLGLRIEVLDTRNAASQFNLLATERGVSEVAAALMPVGFGE